MQSCDKTEGWIETGVRPATMAPTVPVLAQEDMKTLAEALAQVDRDGLQSDRFLPLADALDELAAVDRAGLDFLAGRSDAGDLATLSEGYAPWPADKRSRRLSTMLKTAPVLVLRSAGAPFLAVHSAARLRNGEEAADIAARRLLTFWLWRAEPVTRIVHAARSFAAGMISAEDFVTLLQGNVATLAKPPARPIDDDLDPTDLLEALRTTPTITSKPGPPGPLGPEIDPRLQVLLDWVRKSPFSAFLAPENQARLHCTLGLARLYPLVALPEKSPGPAGIAPRVICGDALAAGGVVLLLTGNFGSQTDQGGTWGVLVNGTRAEILSWTITEIRLRTTALVPGCNPVRWSFASDQDTSGNGVDAACTEWLGRPIITTAQAVETQLGLIRWIEPGSVSVLGPVVETFTTPPAPPAGFIPCTPVDLSWRIGTLPCVSDRANVAVRLLRDGVVVGVGLPFIGAVSVTDPDSIEYRLEITSTDGAGSICGTVTARLSVPRAPAVLTLNLPADVEAGRPAQATVSIPCDAPGGGLLVSIGSVDPNRASVPQNATIPAGQRSVSFTITAAAACGEVKIDASAPGHLPVSGSVCVVQPLTIAPGQMLSIESCDAASATVRVRCLGRLGRLLAILIHPDGTRTTLRLAAGGVPPMGCLPEATLRLGLPALEDGSYTIELGNGLGSAATIPLTVTPRPAEVTSAPASISSFIAIGSCPPLDQTIRISAKGHDRVTIAYENPDGGMSQVFVRQAPFCPDESIQFTARFDRIGTLVITPERNGVAGAVRRVPVTLTFGQGVFSSVTLFASDPAGQRRPVKVTRAEGAPGMQTGSDEGSIAEGQTRSFPLMRCIQTYFFGVREEVPDPASRTGGKILEYRSAVGPYLGHPDAPVQAPPDNF